jgi:urea ABC transporter ATP-binding protein UrtE
MPDGKAILRVDAVQGGYDAVPVLRGVSFNLGVNECLAILGRNGMGKTTLLRSLVGLLPPTSGLIRFDGTSIVGMPPHEIARLGVAYVPQGRAIFAKLTVLENLQIGTRAARQRRDIPRQVFDYFPILRERKDQLGGTLSGGQQQMLAIGRALCGDPKILLMDEPSEGLQPSLVQELGLLLPRIKEESHLAIVIVEQNLDLARSVAQRALIIDKGRFAFECTSDQITDNGEVRRLLTL